MTQREQRRGGDASVWRVPLLPVPATDGFVLRPLRAADAAAWCGYLRDPQVTVHTSWPQVTPELIAEIVGRLRREAGEGTSLRWALSQGTDGELVGTCGFPRWSRTDGAAELAYDLAPAWWGRGLMSAAVAVAVGWAFVEGGFARVEAYVMDTNLRSARLLSRAGFRRERLVERFRVAHGEPRDFWLFVRERGVEGPTAPRPTGPRDPWPRNR
jgi:ribosomal-protein-alanine N-acetyltransferase